MSTQPKPCFGGKPCIGFGAREGACENWSKVHPFLWCLTCEASRREAISAQFDKISKVRVSRK